MSARRLARYFNEQRADVEGRGLVWDRKSLVDLRKREGNTLLFSRNCKRALFIYSPFNLSFKDPAGLAIPHDNTNSFLTFEERLVPARLRAD